MNPHSASLNLTTQVISNPSSVLSNEFTISKSTPPPPSDKKYNPINARLADFHFLTKIDLSRSFARIKTNIIFLTPYMWWKWIAVRIWDLWDVRFADFPSDYWWACWSSRLASTARSQIMDPWRHSWARLGLSAPSPELVAAPLLKLKFIRVRRADYVWLQIKSVVNQKRELEKN